MRKIAATVALSAAALTAGALLIASPASAAGHDWQFEGHFSSFSECVEAAKEGLEAEFWTQYKCTRDNDRSPAALWVHLGEDDGLWNSDEHGDGGLFK